MMGIPRRRISIGEFLRGGAMAVFLLCSSAVYAQGLAGVDEPNRPSPEVLAQVDSALSQVSDLYRAFPGASAFMASSEKRYVAQTILDRSSGALTTAEAEEFLVWADNFFTKLGQYIEETVERVTFDKWPGMEAIVNSDMSVEEQTEAIREMVRGAADGEGSEMEEEESIACDALPPTEPGEGEGHTIVTEGSPNFIRGEPVPC